MSSPPKVPNTTLPIEPLIDAKAACRILGLSRGTLYLMVKRGELPAVRFGPRTIRFVPEKLRRYVVERMGAA